MKLNQIIFHLCALLPAALPATYFGNPALPALQSDGIILSPPRSWSVRLGYMEDYLYRQRYNEEFQIAGTHNPSSYIKLNTNAATITFNIKNWIDFNGILGGARMQIDHEVYSPYQFAWGAGAKWVIFQTKTIFVGLDLKYFQSMQRPTYLVSEGYPFNVVSDFKMRYFEEQVALGAAYRIKMISPYIYASYQYCKIDPNSAAIVVQMPTYDGSALSYTTPVVDKRRWGMAFGATVIGDDKGSVTLESRFFNQNALNVSGELRF